MCFFLSELITILKCHICLHLNSTFMENELFLDRILKTHMGSHRTSGGQVLFSSFLYITGKYSEMYSTKWLLQYWQREKNGQVI